MSTSAWRNWLTARYERSLRRAAAISPESNTDSTRRRWLRVLLLWLSVVVAGGFFDASDSWGFGWGFGWFEGYAYNLASSLRARGDTIDAKRLGDAARSQATDIVIVPLSDETFSPASATRLPGPPVPRDYHAKLTRFLSQAGAKIVAFDLVFDASRDEDRVFADAVRAAARRGTRVLWACIVDEGNQLLLPNQQLRDASSDVAHILVERNPARPLTERVPAYISGDSNIQELPEKIPALSLKVALLAKGMEERVPRRVASGWQIGEFLVPIAEDGTFAISYTSTPQGAFPYVPYEALINPGPESEFFEKLFKDKIVIVGDTTKLGNDWKDTPLGIIPGVEVHAHALSTLLRENFLRMAPGWLNLLLVALLPALLLPLHETRRLSTLVAAAALLFLGYLLFALWLFVERNFSVHFVGPLLTLSFFMTGVLILRGLREERDRRRMFDALVLAASSAIETRDPSTAGHSRRVTCLTIELAIAVSSSNLERFRRVRYSKTQIKELCYSALLHDFGKIGVREAVLTKSHKLEPMHFQVVKDRLLLLRAAKQTEHLTCKVKMLNGGEAAEVIEKQLRDLDAEVAAQMLELDKDLQRLEKANDPQVTFLPDDEYVALQELLDRLEQQIYADENGEPKPLLTPEEKTALGVRKGSLTDAEFKQIQSHAQMSYDFLKQINWTRDLENLAHIAWGHHEKLSGGGYPRGVKADEIPLSTRMMTIADIFDALTASDRPYKKAMPVERALQILRSEAEAGAIDSDLLHIFIDRRVYEATSNRSHAWLFPSTNRPS